MIKNIGILGFGYMGKAIAKGVTEAHADCNIFVYDKSKQKTENLFSSNIEKTSSCKELFTSANTIIFAVKPQDIDKTLEEINLFSSEIKIFGKNIISVIAGKSISLLAQKIKTNNICRFMPNIAAQSRYSTTAVSFHEKADEEFKNNAVLIAESIGKAFVIPEKQIAAFTALSGSAIAFVFQFIHALAMGGVKTGISYDDSLKISAEVLKGAYETLKDTGKKPMDLVTAVSSPAGTTIEGLSALEEKAFNSTVIDAVSASFNRAIEIENSLG
ncbi:MAG: pyrroline-5-carboxylate reductase [Spirochaetes bacterium]|nr:pyrroline-5-carboxylate reductase [Spirochaetota bacterium]